MTVSSPPRGIPVQGPTFGYLRDPLFGLCVGIYGVHRLVLDPLVPHGVVHAHLNDLLCVPIWVPVLLAGLRRLGLRADNGPPTGTEVLVPLLVWASIFEVILPRVPPFDRCTTADHRDVLCYAVGALAAALFWRARYGSPEPCRDGVVSDAP